MHKSMVKLAAALALAALAGSAYTTELKLAANGATGYKVVGVAKPSEMESAAANDLKRTLKEITGADFSASSGKTRSIFIGVRPECDKEPLKECERRITTYQGDLYLYGEGKRGNVNAVYDFLRDVLGCRWYNVSGDKKIPKKHELVIAEQKLSLVPSIPHMTAGRVAFLPAWADFARRQNLEDKTDSCIGSSDTHAGQRIIPSGKIPVGGRIGNTFGPLKYFADRKYFETNPEFFALGPKGKRVITMQLCYSNKAMRDEYVRNILHMLKEENYQGGRIIVGVGQDDNGGKFCYCKDCEALEKKYDHPAGAYYDFLLDLSKRFAKTHPDILLSFLAYRNEQTLSPSKLMKKLPANLLPSYAPLGADITKPLNHPRNAMQLKYFGEWSKIATLMHWWAYPTPYPRPVYSFPLIANLHRIAENFRVGYQNRVWMAYCEFGNGPYGTYGFNDMRLYLLCELCRRIDADEQAIIAEYAEACYGKEAAKIMLKYIAELEKHELAFRYSMRWNPDVLACCYATGENLIRWERDFDAMEKLAGNDKAKLLNIRRARFTLDETLIAKWPYLTKAEQKRIGGIEPVIERALRTAQDDAESICRSYADAEKRKAAVAKRMERMHSGLDQFIARTRPGRPLPKMFAGKKTVYRLLPNRNKLGLDKDPDAAFGLCNTGNAYPRLRWFFIRSFDKLRKPSWQNTEFPRNMQVRYAKVRKEYGDGKYHYVHLGALPIEPNCHLAFYPISSQSGFSLCHLYDPKRPNRLYDFYVSLALPDDKHVKLDELLVIPLNRDATGNIKRTTSGGGDEFL